MPKQITKVWFFASDSNPNKEYETLQYATGDLSCSCPGWCRRTGPNGERTCKHLRLVQAGRADAKCISSKIYGDSPTQTLEIKITNKTPSLGFGKRKFVV